MNGYEILRVLNLNGFTLILEEGGIRVQGGKLSDELRSLIRDNKENVVSALRQLPEEEERTASVTEPSASLPVGEAIFSPPLTNETIVPMPIDQRSTDDLMIDLACLYRSINEGARLGLLWTVSKVSPLHVEQARKAALSDNPVEALGKLGPEAAMAAVVAEYKERLAELERRGAGDLFHYKAALALCAVYRDNRSKWPGWYQDLLDKTDEIRTRGAEIGMDKHVDQKEGVA